MIQQTTIEHITCPSGDWEVLTVNGYKVAEGHAIRNQDWILLLKSFDFTVYEREIPDEEMEIY